MEWIKITADTPLEEVQRMHRQIWDYVIEHGEKPNDCPYKNHCAACEWALRIKWSNIGNNMDSRCYYCPIKWPENRTCNQGSRGLYSMWRKTYFRYLARQIRDLEFKTKEEILK